ncbi:MAG: hypothetical protein RMA76_18640 [Deltaproteobacteria bacterium]|jgi:hypothetical protein
MVLTWLGLRPKSSPIYGPIENVERLQAELGAVVPPPEVAGRTAGGVLLPEGVRAASERRAQLIRYELFANSGRFQSRTRVKAMDALYRAEPRAFKWLVVPVASDDRMRLTARASDAEASTFLDQLVRDLPGTGRVLLLPVHEEEVATLQKTFGAVAVIDDGEMFQTASPRSVLFGAEGVPRLVDGLQDLSVKLHLSDATYARMGGLDGSRQLNLNDCLIAPVFTHLLETLGEGLPRFEVLSEGATVAARLGDGKKAVELGAIFRRLPDTLAVPGFALFSPTKERLPADRAAASQVDVRAKEETRVLAADAIERLRKKNPGLSKVDGFLKLFSEPLLDIAFHFYAQGVTLELHPQNFLMCFDPRTREVEKVYVRDVHGTNYSAAWRTEHGLEDIASVEALQAEFPGITQADLDGWFMRPDPQTGVPKLRDRYKAPGIFGRNFDIYFSIFQYQSLVALEEAGYLTRHEVDLAMIGIRDAVEAAADKHGFDLANLDVGGYTSFTGTMERAFDSGLRGRVLFRRPLDPEQRRKFIEEHEAPVRAAS